MPVNTMTENGSKIFVVDDEQQIVRVLKRALEAAGFTVQSALSGKNALDAIQLWTPDVVITDLAMPQMDGIELCRRLRADVRTRTIPVLVITGHGDRQYPDRARVAGADQVLIKPCDIQMLLTEARRLLARNGHPRTGD